MWKNWLEVLLAACFEVTWVIGFKYAEGLGQWIVTIVACVLSFCLMIHASKKLPVGTVYAVFVGCGTFGTFLTGILIFNEDFKIVKIGLIIILMVGVIGLKVVTDQEAKE